ncbi:hypothetical protein SAMN05216559_0663 [Halomicrobium zhouii]|uniref:IclR helix-turn-helix domain-containing protein n=1 Tax=Halomicrobium zhouii TaxID=767519 RepID=A0A1I6KEG4_9EURY|nr:hypothetical protein [Halomicrobium zhouii]SFR89632.1 hypothetical protein SAMN05216559_0663 [Halomicrobium zhouii]
MSARFRPALLALLALTVAVAPLAAAGASLPSATGSATATQTTATPTEPMPPETTQIEIRLQANGDADWTIRTRLDATTEEENATFRDLANQYESGQKTPPWLDTVRAAAAASSQASGRQMNVTDERFTSDVNSSTFTLRFTWTNFAREEGDHMVVDDAFNTTRGTWLDGLTESQELAIQLPEGYGLHNAPDGAQFSYEDTTSLHWYGPEQFDPGYMEIVFSGDASPDGPGPEGPEAFLLEGLFLVSLCIIAVGAYVYTRRNGELPSPTVGNDGGSEPPSAGPPTTAQSTDDGEETATTGTVEPTTEETEPDDDVDEELLSDEERVERLLEANGGRMKQASIVKETGWSNAKVSQLLSTMEDDGAINKLRIGRENLISFPDEDVTEFDQD